VYHAMVLQLYMPLSMFVSMEQRGLERLNSPCYSKLNRNVILAPSMTLVGWVARPPLKMVFDRL
jgi:hypothetical protein